MTVKTTKKPAGKRAAAKPAEHSSAAGTEDKRIPFVQQLTSLSVGEHASRAWQVEGDKTLWELANEITTIKRTARNNTVPSITVATRRTGATYRLESGEFVTPAGNYFIVVVVTRTS